MLQKQEMSYLNLNLSLQAWWRPYRSNYVQSLWDKMASHPIHPNGFLSAFLWHFSVLYVPRADFFLGLVRFPKIGYCNHGSGIDNWFLISVCIEFGYATQPQYYLWVWVWNKRMFPYENNRFLGWKNSFYGRNRFMIPESQNHSNPRFYGPSSAPSFCLDVAASQHLCLRPSSCAIPPEDFWLFGGAAEREKKDLSAVRRMAEGSAVHTVCFIRDTMSLEASKVASLINMLEDYKWRGENIISCLCSVHPAQWPVLQTSIFTQPDF